MCIELHQAGRRSIPTLRIKIHLPLITCKRKSDTYIKESKAKHVFLLMSKLTFSNINVSFDKTKE